MGCLNSMDERPASKTIAFSGAVIVLGVLLARKESIWGVDVFWGVSGG